MDFAVHTIITYKIFTFLEVVFWTEFDLSSLH